MNLNAVKERYMKEPYGRRLGHLASDLARVASFLDNAKNQKVVNDILEESKFFIEWSAADAPFETKVFFSEIQSKIALWQRHLMVKVNDSGFVNELKESTGNWSEKLIELSGILTA